MRSFVFRLLAVEINLSAAARRYTENLLEKLCSARTVKSGNAENFSLTCFKGHVSQIRIFAAEIFYLQKHVAYLVILGRISVCQLAADHELDYLVHGKLACGLCRNPSAVAHYCDLVAYAQYLLHFMGDIDNRAAAVAQHIDYAEQVLRLFLGKRRRGLVKDDNF